MHQVIERKFMPMLFLSASLAALISAYIMEYRFGISPCRICLYQRIIYFLSIFFSVICLLKPQSVILKILVISYLANMLIAGYQVAVEYNLIENIISCGGEENLSGLTDQEIINLTFSKPKVACDIPQFVIFGISLAGWNVMYCAIVLLIFLYYRKKYEIPAK